MRNSGFILADYTVGLLIFSLLAAYVFGLLLLTLSTSSRLKRFEGKLKTSLLLEIIGNEAENSLLFKKSGQGWEYYRVVGAGIGKGRRCRILYGKRGKYTMVEGKLVPRCQEGKFFLSLRKKFLFLRGNTLYMKTGNRPQPMADDIQSFSIEINPSFFKIHLNGKHALRAKK